MAALSIQVPYPVFYDRDGQPLDNGNIYIGAANLDPVTNPIQVYYDEALTIPASQPLKTSNGYVYRNGTPTQLYVDGANFSILVNDSKNTLVYSFPDGTGVGVQAASIIYNEGSVGAVDRTVASRLQDIISVKDFGAVGDGITDDTLAVQAAIDAAGNQKGLFFPAGVYILSSTLDVNVAGMALIGERNNYTYGIGVQSVQLKWIAGSVCINTYVPPESSTFGDNSPFITLQNLTINGNGIAQIGVDGGFVLTMQNCSVLNCTVASLRLGVGSQTSKYHNCAFNGSLDGVLSLGGGTHYFYDCVLRENTRYGFNGEMTNGSFYNCIFESNESHGVHLTGNCDMMLFSHSYFEQNDAALAENGYQVYVDQTVDNNRMPQIKFDTTVFGSTTVTKVANVQSGGVIFDNCLNVGDNTRDIITVADGAFVRADESFLSNSNMIPAGMSVVPKVFYDPAKALICEGTAGRVVLASPGLTLGAGDFSISLVCSFNNANLNTRTLLNGAVGSFAMVMTGSSEGIVTINWGQTGGSLTGRSVKTPMAPDIPIHIVYVRESGVYKLFINGQKIAQGIDATNYSGAIGSIGANGSGTKMEGRLYAAKFYSGALTFDEVWSLCKNGGNYVGTSTATELLSLEFENRIPGVIYETVGQENLQNFGSWAVTTSDAADFTPVVFGGSSAGVGTYDYQYGSYRVFDGYCYFQLSVKWTAHSGTGAMRISGLPFVSRNLSGFASTFATYSNDITFPAGATSIAAYIGSNTTDIELRGDGSALAPTAVAMDASGTLFISGHYQVQVA